MCKLFVLLLFFGMIYAQMVDSSEQTIQSILLNFPRHLRKAVDHLNNETTLTQSKHPDHCLRDIGRILSGLVFGKAWALKVFDSWGKLSSGIFSGNLYELGDFDQCLDTNEENIFTPQYCVARISKTELFGPETVNNNIRMLSKAATTLSNQPQPRIIPTGSNMLGLNFGICVPNSCTPEMIKHVLQTVQSIIPKDKVIVSLVPDTCQMVKDIGWNIDAGDIICLIFLFVIALLMLASTAYDVICTKQNKAKNELMSTFSVYTNGKKMFECKRSNSADVMECLNGIRVLSALWVIYAHAHVMVMLGPVFNYAYIPKWTSNYSTIVLLLAPFSVDSFLFLSGLLVTWSIMRHLKKTNGKINLPILYLHRYLRLTPVLAVIILFSVTLFKKLGSGPLYYTYILNGINCDSNWWSALLYIQNYYNPEQICLSHTWYLSVDFQLFCFSPIFSFLLYRFKRKFVFFLIFLVFLSVFWTSFLFIHYDLVNQFLNMQNNLLDTFTATYYPTIPRMSPWLIGMIFAYALISQQNTRSNWNKLQITVYWIVTFIIFTILAYYSYELQQIDHEATPLESAIYTPLSRCVWAIILCLIIYACKNGYGGPVNWFLSLPHWQPLARLTYSIYLTHMPIMLLTLASTHRSVYFSERNIVFKFFGDFTVAALLSVMVSLAFESPIVALEKRLLFKPQRKQFQDATQTEDTLA